MILIFAVVLFGFGDCTRGGAVGGYGGYKDLISNWKSSEYGGKQDYVIPYVAEKVDLIKEDDGYNNDDKNSGYDEYVYDKNHYKNFDIREYDYVLKCDINIKDCKDGRDCYDKASDRSGYENCKNQYGDEGRYYDIDDRNYGNRYRDDDNDDRYEKECYDNYKNSDDYDKCRNRKDNRNDYDKDCYDNTKNRDDYNKCRRYYRRCRRDNRRGGRNSYSEKDWRNDRNCYNDDRNLVGLGRRDREDQLIRPCALDDRQCIRKYLAKNSKCKPAYGPIPDPLYFKRNTVYFPNANLTVLRTRLRVTGLASIKISEFYVNKDTKNLVIALDFQNLNQTSPKAYFRYKRTAKESIVLDDFASEEYKSGTFTAVIPKIPHLRLDLAEVHADIDDLIPRIIIGPKAVNTDTREPKLKINAKESIVLYDYASDEYQSGTFTVIPKIPDLRFCVDLAEVHADIDDLVPALTVGPKAFESKDPDVAASVATFFANFPFITQDFFYLSKSTLCCYLHPGKSL